jgi:hypothetical protein
MKYKATLIIMNGKPDINGNCFSSDIKVEIPKAPIPVYKNNYDGGLDDMVGMCTVTEERGGKIQ